MKKLTVFILSLVVLALTGEFAHPQDFLISQEDTLCGFAQSNPQLFPDASKGFIIVWRDNRDGPAECFAQRFDSSGSPVGKNFRIFSDADIAFSPDGSFLAENSYYYSLDPYGYFTFYTLSGAICTSDGLWTQPVVFASKQLPLDCVGCCIGTYHDLSPCPGGYLLTYNDGGLLSISKQGSKLDTTWTWWNGNDPYSQNDSVQPSRVSTCLNGQGDFAVIWLNAPCMQDTLHTVMGTFFSKNNGVLARNIELKEVLSSAPDFDWWWKYRIRVLPVQDSLYEVFLFDTDSSTLSYWKVDRYGNAKDPGRSIAVFDGLKEGSSSSASPGSFSFTPLIGGKFSILISGTVHGLSGDVQSSSLLTFDANGAMLGNFLNDSTMKITAGKWFYRYGDSTIFVPSIENGQVGVEAYRGLKPLWSKKAFDSPPGSNDMLSRVIPGDNGSFMVTWKDSRGLFGRSVHGNGTAGPVGSLATDSFLFLADGHELEIWSRARGDDTYSFGYNIRDDSWSIVSTDTLESGTTPYYAAGVALALPDTSSVVMFQPTRGEDVLWHIGRSGETKRIALESDSSTVMGLVAASDTSFWVMYSDHMRLMSEKLTPLSKEYGSVYSDIYLGNGRFLRTSSDVGIVYGDILSPAGDTLTGRFEILSGAETYAAGRISEGYFIVVYRAADRIYAKTFDDNGSLRWGPQEIDSGPTSTKLDPKWGVNGNKVLISWTDARTPGRGYDTYGCLLDIDKITPVAEIHAVVPSDFALFQNYPNPFNPTTTISYEVPRRSHVTIYVYNVLGQKVATVVDGVRSAGNYRAVFDGSRLASGVYFYRLNAGNYTLTRKLMLIK